MKNAQQYCNDQGYDFIWFCKDIERVYLDKKVDDSQKQKEATRFKEKKLIASVDANRLLAGCYQANRSNIMKVLDQYLERKK
ncbi:MAG: hypothetical protein J6I64_00865 [Lachnospiraceae bacterium]|nr:hypothetical protein [Lachnospiraceae bacterium]